MVGTASACRRNSNHLPPCIQSGPGSAARSGIYCSTGQYHRCRSRLAIGQPNGVVSQKPPRSGGRASGSRSARQGAAACDYLRRWRTGGSGSRRARAYGRTPGRQCLEYPVHRRTRLSEYAPALPRRTAGGTQRDSANLKRYRRGARRRRGSIRRSFLQ